MNKKNISTILIVLGILLITIPLLGTIYTNYQQEKMYNQYLEKMDNQIKTLNETFQENLSDNQNEVDESTKEVKIASNVIGRIIIPDISANLLLVEGTTSEQLQWGAGHVTGTAMPGQTGNLSIAAHRDYTFGTYFSRLDEMETGDKIIVEFDGENFSYLVTESFVVEPDEVSVLAKTLTPTITLITCHPRGSGTKRLIVKGELAEK